MKSFTLLAPAKINLILKVLSRRPDGYHDLFTLFHRISLFDRLTFKQIKQPEFRLIVKGAKLGPVRNNLIYRAHQLLREIIQSRRSEGFPPQRLADPPHSLAGNLCYGTRGTGKRGIEVVLEKKIPHAAGLGGGSSDAAHFLLGMNRFLNLKLPRKTLLKLGAKLGSDVPFFIYNTEQAIGRGRGEKIDPFPSRHKYWFVLLIPPLKISTSLVYKEFDSQPLTRISRVATITSVLSNRGKKTWPSSFLHNDLYPASCIICPKLKRFGSMFTKLGINDWLMSGSGSAMFSIHRSKREAEKVARSLRRQKSKANVFISHTY